MPLVHISLFKGKSADYVRAIADGIHQALRDTFHVPADDRFQLIHQKEPAELIYDPSYLGVQRTNDVIFVNIIASGDRDTATKQAFYERAADLLSRNPGIRKEDLVIVLSPNQRDDWSFGNGIASYVTN